MLEEFYLAGGCGHQLRPVIGPTIIQPNHITLGNHMTVPNFAQLPDTTADPPTADLYSVLRTYSVVQVRIPYRVVLSAPAPGIKRGAISPSLGGRGQRPIGRGNGTHGSRDLTMWGCGANPADPHGRARKMPLRCSPILYIPAAVPDTLCDIVTIIY